MKPVATIGMPKKVITFNCKAELPTEEDPKIDNIMRMSINKIGATMSIAT